MIVTGRATATVTPFYERLYQAAQRQLSDAQQDEFSFAGAVIIAGTAAETAVSVAITSIIEDKELGAVAQAANDSIRSYNLQDPKDRAIWKAITGDTIGRQSFWPRYRTHVKRRNLVVHTGRIDRKPVDRADAEDSIAVVRALLDHITKVLDANGARTT